MKLDCWSLELGDDSVGGGEPGQSWPLEDGRRWRGLRLRDSGLERKEEGGGQISIDDN